MISPDHELCQENYGHEKQSPFSSFFFFSPLAFPRLLLGAMHTPNGERAQLNQPNCTTDVKPTHKLLLRMFDTIEWLSSTRM